MPLSAHVRTYRLLAFLWLSTLVFVSFLPIHWKMTLHTKGHLHAAGHIIAFGVLTLLLARSARTRRGEMVSLVFVALLGFGIELAQDVKYGVPSAGFWAPIEWRDILVDTIAVVIAGILQLGILPVIQQRPGSIREREVLGR